jgi:tRNA pseudouridine13 synthase
MRQIPADFFVEEQLGFEPDGNGEHCWLWVEKENLNTADAAQRLARFAGIRESDISYSGLKDKRAVARQWFSLHVLNRVIDWTQWNDSALRILRVERHSRKLRRGTHRGNRFEIILRDMQGDTAQLHTRIDLIVKRGAPNYFGEQRFGRDGRTLQLAQQAASQQRRLSRQQASLYFSAARSYLFNEVLAQRIADANWQMPLAGEVFMLNRSNSVFQQATDAELLARFDCGDIHLSGPLAGCESALLATAAVFELERSVLARHEQLVDYLIASKVESARRSLRLLPDDFKAAEIDTGVWRFSFALSKGCFATSLMRELVDYYLPTTE